MLLRGREHEVDVEPREEDEPRTHAHGEGQAERQAVGVEHRQHGVDDLLPGVEAGHPGAALRGVGHEVAVAEHGALGDAGRAARVLDRGEVVDGTDAGIEGSSGTVPEQVGPRRRAGRRARELGAQLPRAGAMGSRRASRFVQRHRRRQVDGDDVLRHRRQSGDRGGDLVPGDRDGRAVVAELVGHLASACRAGCARRRRRRAGAPRRTRRCARGSSAARGPPGRRRRRRGGAGPRPRARPGVRARRRSARRRRTRAPAAAPYAATAPASRSTSEVSGGSISAGTPSA